MSREEYKALLYAMSDSEKHIENLKSLCKSNQEEISEIWQSLRIMLEIVERISRNV